MLTEPINESVMAHCSGMVINLMLCAPTNYTEKYSHLSHIDPLVFVLLYL